MNRKIAYITACADTLYVLEIINNLSRQAYLLGYDLIVLTHFVNFTDGGNYIKGDENIYSLIESISFDGAIMDYSSYFSKELADRIEDMLFRRNIPVISLDYVSGKFESCIQDDQENFRRLTEHFIKEHGLRKIYCLTGPESDIHSIERVKGYKNALKANHIAIRNKNIFYGDFWIDSPKALANDILSGKIEKPEAIVCANDYMAFQLCLSLNRGGISVPSEIAVGGFDGNPDVLRCYPSVTTFYGANLKNAVDAVCRIHEKITGEKLGDRIDISTGISIGTSCGCCIDVSKAADNSQKDFDNSFIGNIYLHSNYSSMMNAVYSIEQLSGTLAQNMYLINEKSDFFLCLCSDWEGSYDDSDRFRREGYSDEMICIMSSIRMNCNCTSHNFILENILPDDFISNEPMTFICTPLHCLERCFGYCVRRYNSEIVFEDYYGEFCQIAANTIERIRMLKYENTLKENIRRLSERDILTGLYSKLGLEEQLRNVDNSKNYFGVLYCLSGTSETNDGNYGKEIIAFAQAVNLSAAGMITARIASNEFVIIGECDGSSHPEQLIMNTLNNNLKKIEKQQDISIMNSLVHLSVVIDSSIGVNKLPELLGQKLESYKCFGSDKNSIFISHIRKIHYNLYEKPQYDWNAKDEAAKLNISRSYFQHIYSKFMNISFNADVIAARISLAKRLLTETNLNVSVISERCGYENISHFMKLFRSKTGRTALEYRKSRK